VHVRIAWAGEKQLGLDADVSAHLMEQDVAAAGATRESDHGLAGGKGTLLLHRVSNHLTCHGLGTRGESRRSATGRVDSMAGEDEHAGRLARRGLQSLLADARAASRRSITCREAAVLSDTMPRSR
jgi:hypothetical protein